MHAKVIGLVIIAFSLSPASGQSLLQPSQARVLQFAHTQTVQSAQEIAAVIKMIAGIMQVSLSTEPKPFTLTIGGAADQLALAEWLFVELDQPDPGQPNPVMHEYRLTGVENVVRVYHAAHTSTIQELQELATSIRAITELRLLITENAQRAIVMRGNADQMAVNEWLLSQMDKPRNEPIRHSATSQYFTVDQENRGVLQVFYVAHAKTFQDFQVVSTAMRTIAEVRSFAYNPSRALALRGSAGQMATAEWLFNQMDQPQRSPTATAPGNEDTTRTYRVPDTIDNVLQVFYVTRAATIADVENAANQIRKATRSPWVFPYDSTGAIVFRGTAAQMAQAERLIEEMNRQ
jgi:type II secretory pathway component GspD/PulD (secretin)